MVSSGDNTVEIDPEGEMGELKPFGRFDDQAKRVLTISYEKAERSRERVLDTPHLLIALLRDGGSAKVVLERLGIGLADIANALAAEAASQEHGVAQSPHFRKVIDLAFSEAGKEHCAAVGTEHLLLGLLVDGEGRAVEALVERGATLEAVRSEIMRLRA